MVDVAELRAEFVRLLTVDGPTQDRRRKDYNQAIFDPDVGYAVFTSLDMVLEKFDRAVNAVVHPGGKNRARRPRLRLNACLWREP